MTFRNRFGIPACIVFCVFLGACKNKIEECNVLIDVINENHAGERDSGDDEADVKANVEYDRASVATLSVRKFSVPEVIQLGTDLRAGFKGRLDAQEAIIAAADEDPPNIEKAKAALVRVSAAGKSIGAAEAGVKNFCKE